MANSHPGSYCGQDAYSDMLVTEDRNENIFVSGNRHIQGLRNGVSTETTGPQRCDRPDCRTWGGTSNNEILQDDKTGGDGMNDVSEETIVRRLTPL